MGSGAVWELSTPRKGEKALYVFIVVIAHSYGPRAGNDTYIQIYKIENNDKIIDTNGQS